MKSPKANSILFIQGIFSGVGYQATFTLCYFRVTPKQNLIEFCVCFWWTLRTFVMDWLHELVRLCSNGAFCVHILARWVPLISLMSKMSSKRLWQSKYLPSMRKMKYSDYWVPFYRNSYEKWNSAKVSYEVDRPQQI